MGQARYDETTGRFFPVHRLAGSEDGRQFRTRREAEEADDRVMAEARRIVASQENTGRKNVQREEPSSYIVPGRYGE